MKTTILILIILAFLFTGCGTRRNVEQVSATYDEGVVINGVRWATRNVDSPGTFTRSRYDAGDLFTFLQARTACPRGWRLPTYEEIVSLEHASGGWTVMNGVRGRTFGTASHQIFLPAAGRGNQGGGMSRFVDTAGFYWSSTLSQSAGQVWFLRFDESSIARAVLLDRFGVPNFEFFDRYRFGVPNFEFSIRCVADIDLSE